MLHTFFSHVLVSQRLLGDLFWKILHHCGLGQPLVFREGIECLRTGMNNKTLPPHFTRSKYMRWFLLRDVNIPIVPAVQGTGPPLGAAAGKREESLVNQSKSTRRIGSELNCLT